MAKKTKTTTIRTREELESVMGEYAEQVLERDRLTLEMERQILTIRSQFEERIAACVEVGDGLFEDIQAWAVLNPDAFGAKKSLDLLHGTIGFRTGTPSVRQVPGVKADHSLNLISGAGRDDLIRVRHEINKDRILELFAAGGIDAAELRALGLAVEQTERFYTDVKREDGKEVN